MNYSRLVLIAALTIIVVSSGMANPEPILHMLNGVVPAPPPNTPYAAGSPSLLHHVAGPSVSEHVGNLHEAAGIKKSYPPAAEAAVPAAEPSASPAED